MGKTYPFITGECSDCGREVQTRENVLAKHGKNRDPGEFVCPGCSASRTRLITRVTNLPDRLEAIRARWA